MSGRTWMAVVLEAMLGIAAGVGGFTFADARGSSYAAAEHAAGVP